MKSLVLALLAGSLLRAQAPDPIAALSPSDLARGKKLYEANCSLCHGQTGAGGKGPSLTIPKLRRAPDNVRLVEVIRNGLANTEMPGAWHLADRDIWQIAGYVRSLGRIEVVPLPGDGERGRRIYESKGGCAACHIIHGAGASFAPELTEVGARRSAEYLRGSIVRPADHLPEGFAVVSVTTREGKTIRGIRVNEDSFTVQLRDASNRFWSFRKQDLAKFKKEFDQAFMPGYESRFTAAELDDLVAYLASLRGES